MSWFERFMKKSIEDVQSFKDSIETETEISENEEVINKEEWVWIEGYKGTSSDMTCNDYQYELNHYSVSATLSTTKSKKSVSMMAFNPAFCVGYEENHPCAFACRPGTSGLTSSTEVQVYMTFVS